jgi:hypothetical protein
MEKRVLHRQHCLGAILGTLYLIATGCADHPPSFVFRLQLYGGPYIPIRGTWRYGSLSLHYSNIRWGGVGEPSQEHLQIPLYISSAANNGLL